MASKRRPPWQFSLATLMIVVALSSVVCMIAGIVGYRLGCGIATIAWVFWVTDRLMSHPPEPSKGPSNWSGTSFRLPEEFEQPATASAVPSIVDDGPSSKTAT